MEVHHHPHHLTHKKNWKEYLLEGIMIFVAVSMGFFAEQIREHIIEKKHEKEYMVSMVQDLNNDIVQLQKMANTYSSAYINSADSIPILLKDYDYKKPANDLYFHLRRTIRYLSINGYVTDRTITLLKNSGGLRLVENRVVKDSILDYYNKINVIKELEDYLYKEKNELRQILPVLLKGDMYDKVIDSRDKLIHTNEILYANDISENEKSNFLLKVSDIKGLSRNLYFRLEILLQKSKDLKNLILKEYQIKEHDE